MTGSGKMTTRQRRKRRKGAELLEFTLALLPLLMMMFVLLDAAWAIFVKSTLSYAVRNGVRLGITITGTQATAAGSDLTAMVKANVQSNSMGLLSGSAGLAKIKVNYYQPPAPSDTSGVTVDVSTQPNGNNPLNIMQVSIQGFSLGPLIPRLFGLRTAVDFSSTTISAVAADLIEPSRDPPPIGTAP
jgi:Flp pilus assembly protein TadG